jgi:uncharacterized FlaG/YvyC family protein
MDVQPAPTLGAIASSSTAPAAAVVGSIETNEVASAPASQPVQSTTSARDITQSSTDAHAGIAPAVAKLFAQTIGTPIQLSVSYRVEGADVVTVFTDPNTHKEVAQFPPELLIGLAKFFDQQSGVTLDRSV